MAKKFQRSGHEKLVAGLFGGIAEFFKLDPTVVRFTILMLVLVLTFGRNESLLIFALLYLIAWILIPTEPEKLIKE